MSGSKDDTYVDYYSILGVENDKDNPISAKELSKFYRKLALEYHPDKQAKKKLSEKEQAKIAKRFEEISKANEILQDPVERAKFDTKYFAKQAIKLRYKQQDEETKRKIDELRQREEKTSAEHERILKYQQLKRRINQIKEADEIFIDEWERKRREEKELRQQAKHRRFNATYSMHEKQDARKDLKVSWSSKKLTVTREMLHKIFSRIGKLESVRIYGKKGNRATITFEDPSAAAVGVKVPESISKDLEGIRVEYAEELEEHIAKQTKVNGENATNDNSMPWETKTWNEHLQFEKRIGNKIERLRQSVKG